MQVTGSNCDQGEILACTQLVWRPPAPAPVAGVATGLSSQTLVIIAAAGLGLLLLLVCVPLVCCCVRRARARRLAPDSALEEEEARGKSPMFDELSLPFIDQSLPPTPKVGRVVNGLDILLGHGVSENSLVGECRGEDRKTTFV